jgi:hypothetical protein
MAHLWKILPRQASRPASPRLEWIELNWIELMDSAIFTEFFKMNMPAWETRNHSHSPISLLSVYLSCIVRVVSKEATGGKDLRHGLRKLQTTIRTFPGGASVSSSGTDSVSVSLSASAGMPPFPFYIPNLVGGPAGVLRTSNPPFGPSTGPSGRISASSSSSGGTATGSASASISTKSPFSETGNFFLP